MDLPLFLRDVFCFVFTYKKESRLILGNFSIAYYKYAKINFIKAICGNHTLPFKMKIGLAYTEANVCVKIPKIMTSKIKLQHKKNLTLSPFFMDGVQLS